LFDCRLTVALDDTDRRRFLLAALVSMIALPSLWWVNRDDPSNGPNTASVGVEVGGSINGESAAPEQVATIESTIGQSNLPSEPTYLDEPPIFLDGPASNIGGAAEIAIPNADPLETIITRATYGEFSGTDVCLARNVAIGEVITVINLDNNRTITCRVAPAPESQEAGIILQSDQFTELADLTDAPIPVQIRL
jgi:hypothetical protein